MLVGASGVGSGELVARLCSRGCWQPVCRGFWVGEGGERCR